MSTPVYVSMDQVCPEQHLLDKGYETQFDSEPLPTPPPTPETPTPAGPCRNRMTTGGKGVRKAKPKKRLSAAKLLTILEEYHEEEVEMIDSLSGRMDNLDFMIKCLMAVHKK